MLGYVIQYYTMIREQPLHRSPVSIIYRPGAINAVYPPIVGANRIDPSAYTNNITPAVSKRGIYMLKKKPVLMTRRADIYNSVDRPVVRRRTINADTGTLDKSNFSDIASEKFYREYKNKVVPRISDLLSTKDTPDIQPLSDELLKQVYTAAISTPGKAIDASVFGSLCAYAESVSSKKQILLEDGLNADLLADGISLPFQTGDIRTDNPTTLFVNTYNYIDSETLKYLALYFVITSSTSMKKSNLFITSSSKIQSAFAYFGNKLIRELLTKETKLSPDEIDAVLAEMQNTKPFNKVAFNTPGLAPAGYSLPQVAVKLEGGRINHGLYCKERGRG